ncbi:hypothetical protein M231_00373 [Tremella mesenterica]|uniref:Uncharacterized protein n=1 Tax=Tremella mesenterica TaxID=5217 RepID=A0A4Q1BW45_TREME|nr:uncharacterized protein TREMEDRAFT_63481 [Tremella mesenterica DSM 1558]EIW68308.1 hypothetical protein TREMEDRAFT_63481 [Tremella mesenterica DSM 1558]RXK42383.1 hypothetical protein M231_00373 [Tremella mesenterica]
MYNLFTLLYILVLSHLVSTVAIPVNEPIAKLSNADRLKRGLPIASPMVPFNATRAQAALAKRSTAPQIAYLQGTPTEAGRKRAGTPYETTSYMYYDSASGLFRLTTTTSMASPVIVTTYGTQQLLYYQVGSSMYPICASTWKQGDANNMEADQSGGSASFVLSLCPNPQTVAQAYGSNTQQPIWTIPPLNTWPAPAGFTYYNADMTTTQASSFFAFDEYAYTYLLGGALSGSDFGANSYVPLMSLQFIAQLPT